MNKNELVDAVATATELKKADATKAVDSVFDAISAALKKGDEVRLVVSARSACRRVRPARAATRAPARRSTSRPRSRPSSKAGKTLKEALN